MNSANNNNNNNGKLNNCLVKMRIISLLKGQHQNYE